jgi:glutamate carboxypeptidase
MQATLDSRYGQFLTDLEAVVNIDSGSRCAPGLAAVASFFKERFERLGWHTRLHPFEDGAVPCLEVDNLEGNGKPRDYDFLFLGHMDTVFPEGTARARPFSVKDGRAKGPGVCDMKGGLVTILHAAEAAEQDGIAAGLAVCVAFNSDEEVGSRASRRWFEALAAKSRRVFVFEPCRATGHRVLERKGVGGYEILCHGKAAHAGVEPEKGANAILELARLVQQASGFGRPQAGTTVNVTAIAGGTADNVIPDFARAGFDVRAATIEEARRVESSFKELASAGSGNEVRVAVQGEMNRLPMVPGLATIRLWERIVPIGGALGMEMKLIATGGGSDGNFTAAMGIPTVDAMGPQGGHAHSEDEYLLLESVVPNLWLIVEIMKAAQDGSLP